MVGYGAVLGGEEELALKVGGPGDGVEGAVGEAGGLLAWLCGCGWGLKGRDTPVAGQIMLFLARE